MRTIFIMAAVALALAPFDWPYAYYQILRMAVTIVACWLAFEAFEASLTGWRNLGVVIAIVFNPILPIELDRELWAWVDWAVAAVFVAAAIVLPSQFGASDSRANGD